MKITESLAQEIYKRDHSVKKIDSSQEKVDIQTKKSEMPKDQIDISALKKEADATYAQLRLIVEDLLKRQGFELSQLKDLEPEDIKVDQKARDQAAQMIGEDGPLSPEKVSDRIVNFAKAISNDDPSKFNLLKDAIEEGFSQAKEFMGGELPEISQKTYDLIQEKLEDWKESSN
jgi:hypothetical protein